jgi:hypothetical protein
MNDDFSFEDDFSGDDIDRDLKGGGSPLAIGLYCLQCTEIVPHTPETGDMKIVLEVISGTVPSEVGKTHHEYIKYPEGPNDPSNPKCPNTVRRSIQRRFFYAMGLTTPEEIKANPRVKINLELAVGRRCCGKIAHREYNGKTYAEFFGKGGDLFAVDSPKAAGIPMPAGTTPAAPSAPAAAPPPAEADTFGDLNDMM